MKCEGYKYSEYDAVFRKTVFNVNERGNRVLEVTDVESGQTFLLDFDSAEVQENPIRTWHNGEPKGHGKSIHFGKVGLFEQLKLSGRKQKEDV